MYNNSTTRPLARTTATPKKGPPHQIEGLHGLAIYFREKADLECSPIQAFRRAERGNSLRSPAPPEQPEFEPGCYGRLPMPFTAPGVDGDGFDYEQYRRALPKNPQALAEHHEQTVVELRVATRQQLPKAKRLEKLAQIESAELALCRSAGAAATILPNGQDVSAGTPSGD